MLTWSTLTTLGSDHLPITIFLSSHTPPSPRKACPFTNFHKADWEEFNAETERIPLYQPPALLGKKSSDVFSATPKDTTSAVVTLGTTAALSPMLCDRSSRRETSAALMTSRPCHQAAGPGLEMQKNMFFSNHVFYAK